MRYLADSQTKEKKREILKIVVIMSKLWSQTDKLNWTRTTTIHKKICLGWVIWLYLIAFIWHGRAHSDVFNTCSNLSESLNYRFYDDLSLVMWDPQIFHNTLTKKHELLTVPNNSAFLYHSLSSMLNITRKRNSTSDFLKKTPHILWFKYFDIGL
jgi:hypothetical protein